MKLFKSLALVTAALIAQSAGAQTSEYFVFSGDQATFTVIRNGQIVRQWGIANGTAQYQYPIAVRDTIRTMGANEGDTGAEYDLNGNDLGPRYLHQPGPSRSWDGTTDGVHNYTIDTSGRVWQCDLDWSNPVQLFTAGGLGALTYDALEDTLWVSLFSGSTVTQYDRNGAVLSSFDAGHSQVMALAFDLVDGTLWIHNRNAQGTFEQWSRSGQLLDTIAVPGMEGQNALAGEFRFGQSARLNIALEGSCPGQMTARITGATRGGRLALIYGTRPGPFTNPGNPCPGIVIGIRPPFLPGAPRLLTADANGNASLSANVPDNLCNRGRAQVVDLSTCQVSNLATF